MTTNFATAAPVAMHFGTPNMQYRPTCRFSSVRFVVPALLPLALALSSSAADSVWLSPTNGLFEDATRWSNGVPGAAMQALFAGAAGRPFTVTIASPHPIAGMGVTTQHVTLDLGGIAGISALGPVNVEGIAEIAPMLRLQNGTFFTSASM